MSSREDPTAIVERSMRSHGLASILTVSVFESLLNDISQRFRFAHEIASADHLPNHTIGEATLRDVAVAIERAAKDARDDSTHIDPAMRARAALTHEGYGVLLALREAISTPRPQAEPSRCQRLLDENRTRRRARA